MERKQTMKEEKILDFHVHPFADSEHNLCMYPGTFHPDPAGMKKQLEAAGITHICGSVLQRNHPQDAGFEAIRALNREALALRDILGDFYTPGFHIHPFYVKESCEEIEFMHTKGVNLIGELVPYMHGWREFEEKNWMEIMDTARQYRMVCSYHTPFDYPMQHMLECFPELAFVAAHPGDRQKVFEQEELFRRYPNLYLDLSGTGLFRFGLVRYLISKIGPEKILFGTDYPITNPRMYVQAIYGEELSEDDRALIFHGNAERLLGL